MVIAERLSLIYTILHAAQTPRFTVGAVRRHMHQGAKFAWVRRCDESSLEKAESCTDTPHYAASLATLSPEINYDWSDRWRRILHRIT
jgi:hypothetical protein